MKTGDRIILENHGAGSVVTVRNGYATIEFDRGYRHEYNLADLDLDESNHFEKFQDELKRVRAEKAKRHQKELENAIARRMMRDEKPEDKLVEDYDDLQEIKINDNMRDRALNRMGEKVFRAYDQAGSAWNNPSLYSQRSKKAHNKFDDYHKLDDHERKRRKIQREIQELTAPTNRSMRKVLNRAQIRQDDAVRAQADAAATGMPDHVIKRLGAEKVAAANRKNALSRRALWRKTIRARVDE